MATAQDHIGYRTYGFRDLFADLLTGFSSPSDDGYAVAIVVGSRTWRVRALFATRETAEQVADRLQAELSEHGTDHVLANHSMVRLTRGARERLHLRLH